MGYKEFKGKITAKDLKIGVVVSRFNTRITAILLEGVKDAWERFGGDKDNLDIYWVPGSFEIPYILRELASLKKYDGLLALACVIRGDTPHFEYISSELTRGIGRIIINYGVPIGFGVITADTFEQALERAGGKQGNKGAEALISLIEIINLRKKF